MDIYIYIHIYIYIYIYSDMIWHDTTSSHDINEEINK